MKNYTFTIAESLEHIPVNDTMCAYKIISRTLGTGGKLISSSEYQNISFNKDIKKKSAPGNISAASCYGRPHRSGELVCLGNYAMAKIGLTEAVRNHMYGSDELNKSIQKLYVDKPYDFAKSGEEFEIFCYSGYDGYLYDVSGNAFPRAICFSVGIDGFSEDYYNITKALNMLKQRDDVVFIDHYYTTTFKWIPTNSLWDEVKRFKYDSLAMHTYIMLNIFNIEPKTSELRKELEDWSK